MLLWNYKDGLGEITNLDFVAGCQIIQAMQNDYYLYFFGPSCGFLDALNLCTCCGLTGI